MMRFHLHICKCAKCIKTGIKCGDFATKTRIGTDKISQFALDKLCLLIRSSEMKWCRWQATANHLHHKKNDCSFDKHIF